MRAIRKNKDTEIRIKFIEKIIELMGYKKGYFIYGGLVGKKIKESNLSLDELYNSLLERENYIKQLLKEEEWCNEVNKIIAIFTIISTIPQSITYGGCYEIQNIDTKAIYIGESLNLFKRFSQHVSDLYSNSHHCKALQDAFNESKDISHFIFQPLHLYEIRNCDREAEKHKTLYLEAAHYLVANSQKKELYNTLNPYIQLKEGTVSLNGYNIDCNKVIELLKNDELKILTKTLKTKIQRDIEKNNMR